MKHATTQRQPVGFWSRTRSRIVVAADSFLTMGAFAGLGDREMGDDDAVQVEVEALIDSESVDGRFSAAVERRFESATAKDRFALFFRMMIASIVMYDAFLFIDILLVPDVIWLAVALHLGVGTPVAIGAFFSIRQGGSNSHNLCCIPIATMMMTVVVIFASSQSPYVECIAAAFAIVLVACNIGLAMPFKQAVGLSVFGNLAIGAATITHPQVELPQQVFLIFLNISVSFFALAGNYRIEAGVRRAFLFSLRESLRSKNLARANTELHDLATMDGLTGVANRRHFDATFARIWAQAGPRPVALLMIDIDHFKSFNDRFGHQAGDDCLRLVAATLATAAPAAGALFARYGGEEFALLLEASDTEHTYRKAETMRLAVAALAPCFGETGEPTPVTVSIGCGSIVPSSFAMPETLVAAVDAALYAAKRAGRNRTETADRTALEIIIETAAGRELIEGGETSNNARSLRR